MIYVTIILDVIALATLVLMILLCDFPEFIAKWFRTKKK
jgi:hypothetical protein